MQLPGLAAALHDLFAFAQAHKSKQSPSVWAVNFQTLLQQIDWPGQRTLSSVEYQAKKSFESMLAQLASLDSLLGKLDAQQAIYRLTKLCQAKIFQPESKNLPALQVMGMMEAAAAPLDALWVMGMNDHIWPPVARPNSLVPAGLQRAAKTPNASSEVQTEFAQAIHERLTKSARHVIFSSAKQDGDRELRSSPLLHDIPKTSFDMPLAKTFAEQLAEAMPDKVIDKPWHWLDDQQAPAVEAGEHVSGGTGLLKAQAICPAWAFYQYRLNARALKIPVEGLDAMDRGTLVHGVLELFWDGRDSQYLKNLSAVALQDTVEQAADKVLAEFNAEHDLAFSASFIQLEKERLVKLVTAWLLEVEMQRMQDFEVIACEQENNIEIEGVRIKLVVDRVDKLADGRLLVMDYKTGNKIDFKNWGQATITEPQLPIYAAFLLQDKEVGAVCFAKVTLDKAGFAGISATPDLVQGAAVFGESRAKAIFDEQQFLDWNSVFAHWRDRITQTALVLKQGQAHVQFENEKQLAYCEVLPLLRLAERQLQFEHQQALGKKSL
jgi:exodeoxyribonuclease-5